MMGQLSNKLMITSRIGVICFILPTISAAVLGLTSPPGPTNKCDTDECKVERLKTSASILKYRDKTTSPCDNFFQHVCGNYEKSNFTYNYQFIESQRLVFKDTLIGSDMESADKSPVYKLVHDFYTVCMNDDARGDIALETLKNTVKSMGGWPLLEGDEWKEADFNWIDFVGNAKKAGYDINYFVDWVPKQMHNDWNDTLRYGLEMNDVYFDSGIDPHIEFNRAIYEDFVFKIARDLGATDLKNENDVESVVEFEYSLYKITRHRTPLDAETMTIEDLQKEFPGIDWAKFVEKTLTPFIDPDDKPDLTVWKPSALKEFIELMEKTPKRVQATYAIWKIIQFSLPYLSGEFSKVLAEFHEIFDHREMPREAYCDEMITKYADLAVSRLYLDQFTTSQETIGNMFSALEGTITKMLKESTVLSEDDKKQGIELLESMEYTIGSSDKLADLKELEKYYQDAELSMDNFLQSVLKMNLFKLKKENSNKLLSENHQFTPQKLVESGMPENFINHLYIPVNMIPNLIFDNNLPMYMNFGAAGSVMGSEIFRSLAHLGKKWSEDGTVIPTGQLNCFHQIGDNITEPSLKEAFLESMKDEIISLYIGFRAAYEAYQQYAAESGPELPLPDSPYTVQQLFWISWGRVLCYANEEMPPVANPVEGLDLNVVEYMTMMALANVPEISADFQCPVGSLMNPEKKCSWW